MFVSFYYVFLYSNVQYCHQPIVVADLGWSGTRVKPLILCPQNMLFF